MYFILILLLVSLTNASVQAPSEYAFSTHGIFLVLDDGELWNSIDPINEQKKSSIAITYTFLQALSFENVPVIITKRYYCVLRLLLLCAEYSRTKTTAQYKEIQEALNISKNVFGAFKIDQPSFEKLLSHVALTIENFEKFKKTGVLEDSYFNEIQNQINNNYGFQIILAAYYNFQPNEWIIRDIGSNLVLLLPKKLYINDQETGLNVSAYRDISQIKLVDLVLEAMIKDETIDQAIAKVFIPRTQYQNNQIPYWSICISGHGGSDSYLLMKPKQLFTLIKNLDKKIELKFLALDACSLKKEITHRFQGIIKQNFTDKEYNKLSGIYAFGGIIESVTYVISSRIARKIIRFDGLNKIKINTTRADFNSFFKDLQSNDPINFESTLNKIFLYKVDNDFYPENIPLIRFSSNDFFTPVQAPSLIVSIGSILAQTRDPKKPLNINTFFKKQASTQACPDLPKLILLYTYNIPIYLEIKKCKNFKFPLFVSMTDIWIIRIKGLILEDFDEGDALEALESQFKLTENIIYIIDEIFIKNTDPKNPLQKNLVPAQQKIILNKTNYGAKGFQKGLYYINSLGENMQHLASDISVGKPQPNHDIYNEFNNEFEKISLTLETPIVAKEIEESLIKRKAVHLSEMIKNISEELALITVLL